MSTNAIEGVFPELDEIGSDDLRAKTVGSWRDALDRGGWTADDLHRIPASLLIADLGIDLASHVRAVTRVALAVADAYDEFYPADACALDRDVVAAGGLLHDVGKVLEYAERDGEWAKSDEGEYVRHPFSGVAICDARDVPPAVLQTIAFHSGEGDPYDRTPEAEIIHYADFANFDPLR